MANPDYNELLNEIWGWPDEYDCNFFAGASNIVLGTNPAYAISDFLAWYPQFGNANPESNGPIPTPVLQAYVTLASASLVQRKYQERWLEAMANFIAHYCTLWMQAAGNQSPSMTAQQIAQAGIARGILVAKSAAGVSGSYTPVELEGWVTFNLTLYGQMFATVANSFGSGGMLLY